MTGVAVLVIDKVGRRPLLIGGVSGMVSLFNILGWFFLTIILENAKTNLKLSELFKAMLSNSSHVQFFLALYLVD